MASLRKKRVDAAVDAAPQVAVGPAANETPAPALAPKADDAAEALRKQLEALRRSETLQQQSQIAKLTAQERRQDWIKNNPLAQQHYNTLNALHAEAIQAGHADTSPAYFDYLNDRLEALNGHAAAATQLVNEAQQLQQRATQSVPQHRPASPSNQQRTSIVSAPVSREVPSSGGFRQAGKITLTAEQRESARISGISEAEYARQLSRLNDMKATGEYSDRR